MTVQFSFRFFLTKLFSRQFFLTKFFSHQIFKSSPEKLVKIWREKSPLIGPPSRTPISHYFIFGSYPIPLFQKVCSSVRIKICCRFAIIIIMLCILSKIIYIKYIYKLIYELYSTFLTDMIHLLTNRGHPSW